MNSNNFATNDGPDMPENTPQSPDSLRPPRLSPVSGALLTAACVLLTVIYSGFSCGVLPVQSSALLIILFLAIPALFAFLCDTAYPFQTAIAAAAAVVAPILISAVYPQKESGVLVLVGSVIESLSPVAVGFALYVSVKRKMRRTGAIVFASTVSALLWLVLICLSIYYSYGSLDESTVLSLIDELRLSMTASLDEQFAALSELYGTSVLADFSAEALVNSVFNVLPAIFTILLTVSLYIIQRLLFLCYSAFHLKDRFTPEMKTFEVSAPCAVIFAVCYLMSVILYSNKGPAKAVFDNLSMILEPGLAVTGLLSLLPKRDGNMVRIGCFPIAALIIVFFISQSMALLLLAVIGTVFTIKKAYLAAKNGQDGKP